MKYKRTKDGIYEIVEDNNTEWGKQIVVKFPKNLNMKLADVKDQIIKQTDSIEELCDEFVVVFEDKNNIVYSEFKWAMDKAMWSGMPFIIYGAIWTDKGLIYIAKMNEKGELVLI